jgi:hypothetical protein
MGLYSSNLIRGAPLCTWGRRFSWLAHHLVRDKALIAIAHPDDREALERAWHSR